MFFREVPHVNRPRGRRPPPAGESVSGPGRSRPATPQLRKPLPKLMKAISVLSSTLGALGILLCLTGAAGAQDAPKRAPSQVVTKIIHADPEQAARLVAGKKVAVLDIRTPREFAAGHIAGATNLDFYAADFEQRLGALDKRRTWLVHCASGGRSTKSLESLRKLKFPSVVHLDGGFNAWKKAGEPIAK